jgi:hypothetical protein
MEIKRLGIFATAEEVAHIKHCQSMPLMAMTNPAPPGPGVPHAVPMFEQPIEAAHRAALAHGLKDFSGYYGIDLSNGEFCIPADSEAPAGEMTAFDGGVE